MLLLAVMKSVFVSCDKDVNNNFDYPIEFLYGTQNITDVKASSRRYDVTTYPYTKFGMSISFKSDGSFYGKGYFGSSTYKVTGNTIVT